MTWDGFAYSNSLSRLAYLGSNESTKPYPALIAARCNLWRNWDDIQVIPCDIMAIPCDILVIPCDIQVSMIHIDTHLRRVIRAV